MLKQPLDETMHITTIRTYNNAKQATILYNAAWSVFKSLPPLELLANYDKQKYDEWYDSRFQDTADGWSSGPTLFGESPSFILETPTSGRLINISFYQGEINNCAIIFPDGSVNAASEIILEAQKTPLDRSINVAIHVGGFTTDGQMFADIEHIVIEQTSNPYERTEYHIRPQVPIY